MPSYFCCKCHELQSSDLQVAPAKFVCEQCKKEESASGKEDVSSPETNDEQTLVVCGIADWNK
jgi:hypothetical protein